MRLKISNLCIRLFSQCTFKKILVYRTQIIFFIYLSKQYILPIKSHSQWEEQTGKAEKLSLSFTH